MQVLQVQILWSQRLSQCHTSQTSSPLIGETFHAGEASEVINIITVGVVLDLIWLESCENTYNTHNTHVMLS